MPRPHRTSATILHARGPRAVALGATGVLAAGALGGIAYASIPNSSTGQITACYVTAGTTKGQLKVIDA